MSLEPINSALTKHFGEVSHALLTTSTEIHTGNPAQEEAHHMVFEGSVLSSPECSSWQVCGDVGKCRMHISTHIMYKIK